MDSYGFSLPPLTEQDQALKRFILRGHEAEFQMERALEANNNLMQHVERANGIMEEQARRIAAYEKNAEDAKSIVEDIKSGKGDAGELKVALASLLDIDDAQVQALAEKAEPSNTHEGV